jgi:hypothetical protein
VNSLKPYQKSFVTFAQTFAIFAVKKKQLSIVLLLTLFFNHQLTFCQTENVTELVLAIAEELAATESSQYEATELVEQLTELSEDPVVLNSATENEISRLFFLTDFQIKSLVDYIHSSGKILSVFEIVNIPGFDRETVEMMIPFISLEGTPAFKRDTITWNNNLLTNIIFKPGEKDTNSIGSPVKILSKYRFRYGDISGGFTVEKDQGEKFLSGTPPLPEFFSAHISYTGQGIIRKVIIGDYSARFGLGTNINSGIRNGLSLSSPGFISSRNEIKPYTSSDENNFFRGASAALSWKVLDLSLFYSRNKIDATLNEPDTSKNTSVKTFLSGGMHNTHSLLMKKDAVTDEAFGMNLSGNYKNLRMGITFTGDRFSLPVIPEINNSESLFDFSGSSVNILTVYYNTLINRNMLFGELSSNNNNNMAFVQGLSIRPSDRLSLNFIGRKYEQGFFSFHGKGPGAGSESTNEKGMAASFSYEAAKHLFISGGCDVYRYDWLRYRNSGPSDGSKKELRIRYEASTKMVFEGSYIYRMNMSDSESTEGIPPQSETITRSTRIMFRYLPGVNLTLTSRLDFKAVHPSGSKGVMMLQDINFRFRNIPVSFWYRYCLFRTGDWNSRIYTYENDLLYSFSIPALSGSGSRTYLMIKWEPSKNAELRIKYGLTSTESESGLYKSKSEVKVQFRVWF